MCLFYTQLLNDEFVNGCEIRYAGVWGSKLMIVGNEVEFGSQLSFVAATLVASHRSLL